MLSLASESLALAWGIVWLLGHWLAGNSRTGAIFLLVFMMAAFGLLSRFCIGAGATDPTSFMITFGSLAAVLSLSMLLASYACRKKWSPGRFHSWLYLWMVLLLMGLLFLNGATRASWKQEPIGIKASLLAIMAATSVVFSGLLCLLNWPFLELAFHSPFYGERFRPPFPRSA